jgi:hypothetical protein
MYEYHFDFKIKKMAEILETSRSGYYEWVQAGLKTKTGIEDEYFLEIIKAEFKSTRETFIMAWVSQENRWHLTRSVINLNFSTVTPGGQLSLFATIYLLFPILSRSVST